MLSSRRIENGEVALFGILGLGDLALGLFELESVLAVRDTGLETDLLDIAEVVDLGEVIHGDVHLAGVDRTGLGYFGTLLFLFL